MQYELKFCRHIDLQQLINRLFFAFPDNQGNLYAHTIYRFSEDVDNSGVYSESGTFEVDGYGQRQSSYLNFHIFRIDNLQRRDPETFAISRLQQFIIKRNLNADSQDEQNNGVNNVVNRLRNINDNFHNLLESSNKEEELQLFVKSHPIILYVDYLKMWSKLPLGSEYDTDFVFLNRAWLGTEYVFVEIERADKKIFTKSGIISSEYTQAKGQIINWRIWIEDNHAYIRNKLDGLHQAVFHLVIGRSTSLDSSLRRKAYIDASASLMRLSTYDDLHERMNNLIERLGAEMIS